MPPTGPLRPETEAKVSETQKVTLVKSDRDRGIEVLSILVGWAAAYYVLHPEIGSQIHDWWTAHTKAFGHRLSVWRTREDIRNLPETDDNL